MRGVMKMPPDLFPKHPTLKNFKLIFKEFNFIWIINTVIVAACVIIISVITSCAAGYAFAHFKIKGGKILWMILLSGIMIPRIVLYIPQYVILRKIGLSGTIAGVVLPLLFAPVSIYLARVYFRTVPKAIIESARLDGANEIQILKSIIISVSKPIVTALSLFAGMAALNDYVWQNLVLQREQRQTLIVGLMRIITSLNTNKELGLNPLGLSMAVGTLLIIPVLLVFIFASKYFVNALGGALKE